jgi:hypothetical protein
MLAANGRHLLPTQKGLVAWSKLFRRADTYSNYVGHLKTGCLVLDLDTSGMDGPLVKRARAAVRRRERPPRERKFLQKQIVVDLMRLALQDSDHEAAMMYLAAYSFLLRVPSECLLMTAGGEPLRQLPDGRHSSFATGPTEVTLRLAKKKNKLHGSVISRGCSCEADARLCPVHVLGKWMAGRPPGEQPFRAMSPAWALGELRRRLGVLRVS